MTHKTNVVFHIVPEKREREVLMKMSFLIYIVLERNLQHCYFKNHPGVVMV